VFGPPAGADVAVRFSGPDPVILRQLADEATSIFEEAGTITNPRTNWRQREILIEPVVDESRMRLAGATRSAIADTIRFGTSGLRVGELREGDVVIPILLRLPESERDGIGHVRDLSVWSAGAGSYVPMANLVERFETRLAEALIHRRDRERTITALGGARSDLTADEAFRSVRAEIEAIPLPEGYSMEWGGEFESAGEAQQSLGKQLPLGFLVMLTISILMFNKIRQPLILWLVVPHVRDGHGPGAVAHRIAFHLYGLARLPLAIRDADEERDCSGRRDRLATCRWCCGLRGRDEWIGQPSAPGGARGRHDDFRHDPTAAGCVFRVYGGHNHGRPCLCFGLDAGGRAGALRAPLSDPSSEAGDESDHVAFEVDLFLTLRTGRYHVNKVTTLWVNILSV